MNNIHDLYKPPFRYDQMKNAIIDSDNELFLLPIWRNIEALQEAELGQFVVNALNEAWEG